jgi:hypothetical protein
MFSLTRYLHFNLTHGVATRQYQRICCQSNNGGVTHFLCHLIMAKTLAGRWFDGVHRTNQVAAQTCCESPNLFWFSIIDELGHERENLVCISIVSIVPGDASH